MKTASKVLLALAVLGGLVIVAGGAAFVVLSLDESPPDDSDLRVERLDIPDEENAFAYLQQAGQTLYWPEEREAHEQIWAIVDGKVWDEALVEELLVRNREALRLFERGLACVRLQVPENQSVFDLCPYLGEWGIMAYLSSMHARFLFRSGKQKQALDEVMKTVRFGHAIEGAEGNVTHYFTGMMVKEMGLRILRDILPNTTVASDQLNRYVQRLARYGAHEDGLADTLRVECGVTIKVLEDLKAGRMDLESLQKWGVEDVEPRLRPFSLERVAFIWHFKLNQTKRLFVGRFRVYISDIRKPYADMERPELQPHFPRPLHPLIPSNEVGEAVYYMLVSPLEGVLALKCQENVRTTATRLLIAMKAYKMEQGRLPETLDELVPEYIDAVPVDDFDGKPMRYNPEKKVVYSVGEDLEDDGGTTKAEWFEMRRKQLEESRKEWAKDREVWEALGMQPNESAWEFDEEQEEEDFDIWRLPDPSFPIEF